MLVQMHVPIFQKTASLITKKTPKNKSDLELPLIGFLNYKW